MMADPVNPPRPALAQDYEDQPIRSLEINSKVGMTIETFSRLTGIHTGIPYSSRTIRQSLDALYATGLFTNIIVEVEPMEGGVAVVYQLWEKTIISELSIRGNHVFW